jgi:hypothetical protein
MRFYLFALFTTLLCTACEKEPLTKGVVMDLDVNFHVVDRAGNNVLKTGAADLSSLYYIIDGKASTQNLNAQNHFKILKYEGAHPLAGDPFLRVYANTLEKAENTSFLLKWKDGNVDSVTTALHREGPSIYIKKIWLNGHLLWPTEKTSTEIIPRTVKLVKASPFPLESL